MSHRLARLHRAMSAPTLPPASPAPAIGVTPSSGNPEYDQLPEAIKAMYSPKEYAWLTDAQRANIVQDSTEPEWTEP